MDWEQVMVDGVGDPSSVGRRLSEVSAVVERGDSSGNLTGKVVEKIAELCGKIMNESDFFHLFFLTDPSPDFLEPK
ncbi:MAG: hypothetical protein V1798_11290, partial [Pseudomonadota bacterium]